MAAGIKIRKGRPGIRFTDKALKSAELQSLGSRRPRRAGRWAELRPVCHSRRNHPADAQTARSRPQGQYAPTCPSSAGRNSLVHIPQRCQVRNEGAFAIHEAVVGPVRRLDKGMIKVGIKNLLWSGWRKKSSRRHFSQYVDIF